MFAPNIVIATADHDVLAGDPWLDATVSAQGVNLTTSAGQPIAMSDGFHCSDLYTANGAVDPTVASVQNQALSDIQGWLGDWQPSS